MPRKYDAYNPNLDGSDDLPNSLCAVVDEHNVDYETARKIYDVETPEASCAVAIGLGGRALGLLRVLELEEKTERLNGLLASGKVNNGPLGASRQRQIRSSMAFYSTEARKILAQATGLQMMEKAGLISDLDVSDETTRYLGGLRAKYVGPQNMQAREEFRKTLKEQL